MEQVSYIIVGAIIGGIVSYFFNLSQDKKKTKEELTLKASEELIDRINILSDALDKLSSCQMDYIHNITQFNELVSSISKEMLVSNSLRDTYEKSCDIYVIGVEESTNYYVRDYREYSNAFHALWSHFQSRQLILYDFINMYKYIVNENEKMVEIHYDIFKNHFSEISINMKTRKMINHDAIEKADASLEDFKEKITHLKCYLHDFKIELQNYYLSKLFSRSIPRRNPRDKSLIVLTRHIKIDEIDIVNDNNENGKINE
jgi:hypothetical protein